MIPLDPCIIKGEILFGDSTCKPGILVWGMYSFEDRYMGSDNIIVVVPLCSGTGATY